MEQGKEKNFSLTICLCDLLIFVISYLLANYLWLVLWRGEEMNFVNVGTLLSSFIATIFLFGQNRDFSYRNNIEELLAILKNVFIFAVMVVLVLFLMKRLDRMSRGVFSLLLIFDVLFDYLARSILKKQRVRKRKRNVAKLLLISKGKNAEKIIRNLEKESFTERIAACYLVDNADGKTEIAAVPVLSSAEEMLEYARREIVDEVFIALSSHGYGFLKSYVKEFEKMGITVHIGVKVQEELEQYNKRIQLMGSYPVITFAMNFYSGEKLAVKRLMDVAGGIVGSLLTLVVMFFLFPIIKLDSPGPILFKQKRVGKNGRFFYIYKFRSMYVDAETRKKELMKQNEMKGQMFKMTNDPRVTRVGRFIRATSIDELPQFFNVLRGDMSLVGTRPPTVDEFMQYDKHHKRRLSIKPGITGMWQVSGRSDIEDFEEVVRLDLYYIDNWSLTLDIKLLLKTVAAVLKRTGSR